MKGAYHPSRPRVETRSRVSMLRGALAQLGFLGTCVLSALPPAVAIALLVDGNWLGGLLLAAGAGAWLALLLATARLDARASLAQALPLAAELARSRARLGYVAGAAWSATARELVRARRQQQRLHAVRRAGVSSLGEAVARGDYVRAASLRSATRALATEIKARDEDVTAAVRLARRRIARERVARERRLRQAA